MANPDPTRGTHEERPKAPGPAATEWLGEAAERLVRPYAELLADRIEAAAAGLRTAAQKMTEEEERSTIAERLRRTAEEGEALAGSARHDSMDELLHRAADFARARPAAFLGATAAAGWVFGVALQSRAAGRESSADAGASGNEDAPQSPHHAQEQTKQ